MSPKPTQTFTQDTIYTAVRAYIKEFLGYDDEHTRRAFVDNVPLPTYPFALVTLVRNTGNATNEYSYNADAGTKTISTSQIIDVQLDFYGPDSNDDAEVIEQIFRDAVSTDYFADSGLVPLYADEVIQTGRTDENQNFMVRNTLTLHFNMHPQITLAQDFFTSVDAQTIAVPQDIKTGA